MNHPDQHEWISYLYGEVDTNSRSRLRSHLAACETCRAHLEEWQRVRRRLDAWKLPLNLATRQKGWSFPQLMRWAAAAMFMITLGFALGRFSGPSPQAVAALREELHGELTQLVEAQVAESGTATLAAAREQITLAMREFVDFYQAERSADNQAISTALTRLDTVRTADFLSLRKDLETVALNSDVGLRQTRQQLVRLADYSEANTFVPHN
jgi:anti-sigma factor RsiW